MKLYLFVKTTLDTPIVLLQIRLVWKNLVKVWSGLSVENTNKKGTQEGGSQRGGEKEIGVLIPSEPPQIWLSTIFDGTCLIKQGITLGVRVTITNNGFMRPFRLNRILNLTDIMLSTFAYSNLTTVFISHHFRFSSHDIAELKRTVEVEDHISSYLVRSGVSWWPK